MRGIVGGRHRGSGSGRRHDAHAEGAGDREAALRQGAAQGRQPRRGGGDRRGDPGRRAAGRRQGRAPARRDAAVARHRDAGRRVHAPDRPQHHDPDQEEPGLLHRRGQSGRGDDPRLPGRARDGGRQQAARASSTWSAFRPRRAACRRSRSPSTSTPTASSTSRPRTRAPARSSRSASRPPAVSPTTEIEKMVKDAEAHAEEDKQRRELVDAKNQAEALGPFDREGACRARRQGRRRTTKSTIETALADLKSATAGEDVADIQAKTQALAAGLHEARRGDVQGVQEAGPVGASGGDGEAWRLASGSRRMCRRRFRGNPGRRAEALRLSFSTCGPPGTTRAAFPLPPLSDS